MLVIDVEATSGHYRVPGNVAMGGVQGTFPIAPPSTIKGFLESLCDSTNAMPADIRIAYGWKGKPKGKGLLYRTAFVWASTALPHFKDNHQGD